MPTTITHGLATFTNGDFLDEVSIQKSTEVSERRGTDGNIAKVQGFNPTSEFSIKGGGNPAIALGAGGVSFQGDLADGVIMVNKFNRTEKNSEFDDHELGGKHYPNAS